jgi:LPS O-antigen subunit length determinant protein (WzzB/FepE family)
LANWDLIKTKWISGEKAKDIAKTHRVTAEEITKTACLEKWKEEKEIKCKEIAQDFEAQRKRIIQKALDKLEARLDSEEDTDIQTIKSALDISGLKQNKVDNTHEVKQPLTPEQRKQIAKDFGFE